MQVLRIVWVLGFAATLLTAGRYDDWLEDEVKWIASRQEKESFKHLGSEEERAAFADLFWNLRDPTPETERNEYKEEFYRRYQYANRHFREGIPGWRTDRGRIYILHGAPDQEEFISADSSQQRRGVPASSVGAQGGRSSRQSIVWTYFQLPQARYYKGRVLVVFQHATGLTEGDLALSESVTAQQQARRLWRRGGVQSADLIPTSNRYRLVSVGRPGAVNSRGTDAPLSGIGDSARMVEDLLRSPGDTLEEQRLEEARLKSSRDQMRQQVEAKVTFESLPVFFSGRLFPQGGMANLVLTWQVPFSELSFEKEKDLRRSKLDLIAQVRDEGNQLVDEVFKSLDLVYDKSSFRQMQSRDYLYVNEFNLPYGKYTVTTAVKDVSDSRTGVVSAEFDLTPQQEGRVALSDLVLSKSLRQDFEHHLGRNLFFENWQIVPQPDRIFRVDDKAVLFFRIYNAADQNDRPALTVKYKFLDNTGVAASGTAKTLREYSDIEGKTVSYSTILDLSNLRRGTYRIQVSIVDHHSKTFAVRRSSIEIK